MKGKKWVKKGRKEQVEILGDVGGGGCRMSKTDPSLCGKADWSLEAR